MKYVGVKAVWMSKMISFSHHTHWHGENLFITKAFRWGSPNIKWLPETFLCICNPIIQWVQLKAIFSKRKKEKETLDTYPVVQTTRVKTGSSSKIWQRKTNTNKRKSVGDQKRSLTKHGWSEQTNWGGVKGAYRCSILVITGEEDTVEQQTCPCMVISK